MSNAPVCNVKGVVLPPSAKLPVLQPIPKATDLPSALKAIQALTNNFNTVYNSSGGNFVELPQYRTYQTVRVYDPADNSVYVDVQQITRMVFGDATGNTITWNQ
jgi:hypothetical protein